MSVLPAEKKLDLTFHEVRLISSVQPLLASLAKASMALLLFTPPQLASHSGSQDPSIQRLRRLLLEPGEARRRWSP